VPKLSPNLLLCLLLLGLTVAAAAQSNIVAQHSQHIKSKHSVARTVERALRIAEHNELRVLGVIDHSENAAAADVQLLAARLLVFEDPRLSATLLQENPLIGLDLPLKLLVWEDREGIVWISYSSAEFLQKRYKLSDYPKQFLELAALLKDLAQAAGQ